MAARRGLVKPLGWVLVLYLQPALYTLPAFQGAWLQGGILALC